ncbi:MAG TPA: TetR/AcrR family transcriptional regulator [Steroidobacteraceae bacterium]|nr:TetR/AcrR family transcriptional regulator [Steroidobacteraceae bacterium]
MSKRRTKKRTRRSPEEIRDRIVRAAGEEFKRRGFTGATTARIAGRAGVTEAQLYRYFGSKSGLFLEVVFKPLDRQFLAFIQEHVTQGGESSSVREMTQLYTTKLQRFIAEHSALLTTLVVAQIYDAGMPQGVGRIHSLAAYFEHGAEVMSRRMKPGARIDPKLMVRVSFATVLACVMFQDWIFPAGLASDKAIRAAINDFVLEGIGANLDLGSRAAPRPAALRPAALRPAAARARGERRARGGRRTT